MRKVNLEKKEYPLLPSAKFFIPAVIFYTLIIVLIFLSTFSYADDKQDWKEWAWANDYGIIVEWNKGEVYTVEDMLFSEAFYYTTESKLLAKWKDKRMPYKLFKFCLKNKDKLVDKYATNSRFVVYR